jgi:DNA uptake protein ComE-like DNA-binding protein
MWKDFFYFSRRERLGILMLVILISGVFIGKFLFTPKVSTPSKVEIELSKNSEKQDIIPVKANEAKEQTPYASFNPKTHYTQTKPKATEEKRTFYSQPEKPPVAPKQNQYPATEKFATGTVIEINSSDTLQLVKIPGIGASFAKRIAGYRNLLGGYYRLEQLQEVYGMYVELYEKITPYLKADSCKITAISVNSASLDKLKSHPYINFYQAKAIVELRKKKGKLLDIQEFSLLDEFTADDLERLKHYLTF